MEKVNHIENIVNNYSNWEKEMVVQLTYSMDNHNLTTGSFREDVWKNLFERIVPKKFRISGNVFIIDSKGNCSKEVDLAVYDEQYTPYIFNYGVMKFIPIEAVAAVVQCKSSSLNNQDLNEWAGSIEKLETSQESIVRMVGNIAYGSSNPVLTDRKLNMQTQTNPIKILCSICEKEYMGEFDIHIRAIKGQSMEENRLDISFSPDKKNLEQWYWALNHGKGAQDEIRNDDNYASYSKDSNHPLKGICDLSRYHLTSTGDNKSSDSYEIKRGNDNISLLSFIFQFNQLLMLINNPILFPHRAYAGMFNSYLNGKCPQKENND